MSINQNDIIYFILTDRFQRPKEYERKTDDPKAYHGGNFCGIIERIPYLKNLGITALWITPVYLQILEKVTPTDENYRNSGYGYHGYWTLDFNRVDPHLYKDKPGRETGAKLYLKDLVDELHKNGIKLILDVVVNHAGYGHPGVTNSPANPTPIRSDWFNAKAPRTGEDDQIKNPLAGLPDFNLDSPNVIDYHIDTIISWIRETGIDGIRMDTAKHVERNFWNYYKTQIQGFFPDVSLIGEVYCYENDYSKDLENIPELGKYQQLWAFDSLFDLPMTRTIEETLVKGKSLALFVSPFNQKTGILERDTNYTNHNKLVTLLDNHDLPQRFFTFLLDNVNQEKEKAIMLFKLSLSLLFTFRGIPQIYYGTELCMQGRKDPDNRGDFPWDMIGPDNHVKDNYPDEKEVYEHLKKLIQIRKENTSLTSGSFVCLYVDQTKLVFLRYFENNVIIVAINNDWVDMSNSFSIEINENSMIPDRIKTIVNNGHLRCLHSGQKITPSGGRIQIQLSKKMARIFLCE